MSVLNKRDGAKGIYIGRPSEWGNPFVIGLDGDRAAVIERFRRYARIRLSEEPTWLEPLRGKDLVCWCAPLPCHGDVIVEMLS
jgi:hypothetical protein